MSRILLITDTDDEGRWLAINEKVKKMNDTMDSMWAYIQNSEAFKPKGGTHPSDASLATTIPYKDAPGVTTATATTASVTTPAAKAPPAFVPPVYSTPKLPPLPPAVPTTPVDTYSPPTDTPTRPVVSPDYPAPGQGVEETPYLMIATHPSLLAWMLPPLEHLLPLW